MCPVAIPKLPLRKNKLSIFCGHYHQIIIIVTVSNIIIIIDVILGDGQVELLGAENPTEPRSNGRPVQGRPPIAAHTGPAHTHHSTASQRPIGQVQD